MFVKYRSFGGFDTITSLTQHYNANAASDPV